MKPHQKSRFGRVCGRWPWSTARRAAGEEQHFYSSHGAAAAAAAVSTRNPPPCDLGEAVMKIDLNGSMRARTDDERTEAGVDESHTFFIVCPATSVSANHSCLVLFATPSLTVAFFLPGLCAQRRTHGRPHRQVVQVPNQCLLGDFPGGRRLLLECCACTSTRGGEGVQRARGAWRGHARRPRALGADHRLPVAAKDADHTGC